MCVFSVFKCNQIITKNTLFIIQFIFLYFLSGVCSFNFILICIFGKLVSDSQRTLGRLGSVHFLCLELTRRLLCIASVNSLLLQHAVRLVVSSLAPGYPSNFFDKNVTFNCIHLCQGEAL
jgi:hypothetical protein